MNENLNWTDHIAALKLKMSRNAGILFKVKGILPTKVIHTLYYCFIHSHLNYCSSVWGLDNKKSLEPIFISQKRAIRALIPGYVNYFYNKETKQKPHSTKEAFTENEILTVHNQVLLNSLVSLQKIILDLAPVATKDTFYKNQCIDANNSANENARIMSLDETHQPRLLSQQNSFFYKTVRLYNEISDYYTSQEDTNIKKLKTKPLKRELTQYLLTIQSSYISDEWTINNFRLYHGVRASERIKSN